MMTIDEQYEQEPNAGRMQDGFRVETIGTSSSAASRGLSVSSPAADWLGSASRSQTTGFGGASGASCARANRPDCDSGARHSGQLPFAAWLSSSGDAETVQGAGSALDFDGTDHHQRASTLMCCRLHE